MNSQLKTLRTAVAAKPKTTAVLLVALILCALFALNGQSGSSSGDGGGAYSTVEPSMNGAADFSSEPSFGAPTAGGGMAEDKGATPDAPSSDGSVTAEREMVIAGSIKLKVSSPVGASDDFVAWVEANGGYVEDLHSTSYENYDGSKTSDSTVVIRMEDLKPAIAHLKDTKSEVLEETVKRDDVTAQGADLDARIEALQTSIERLTGFMKQTQNYRDLFQVESELTARQAELDSIVAQRKALTAQVQLQTLTVTFTATEKASNPAEKTNKGFKDGARDGWNGVVSFVSSVVYLLAAGAPWLIVVLPLALVGWLVLALYRRAQRRNAKS